METTLFVLLGNELDEMVFNFKKDKTIIRRGEKIYTYEEYKKYFKTLSLQILSKIENFKERDNGLVEEVCDIYTNKLQNTFDIQSNKIIRKNIEVRIDNLKVKFNKIPKNKLKIIDSVAFFQYDLMKRIIKKMGNKNIEILKIQTSISHQNISDAILGLFESDILKTRLCKYKSARIVLQSLSPYLSKKSENYPQLIKRSRDKNVDIKQVIKIFDRYINMHYK